MNNVEVKEQYRVKMSNRIANLENLYYTENINRAAEYIAENINISVNKGML
jgi:hypothetical protein